MLDDDDARYDALTTRDPRFDGVFFVGVHTTGIYCRPICPARTPGRPRCAFFTTPALAEKAGFRACFRCRPELAPGNPAEIAEVDAIDRLVDVAARRIGEGALNEQSVDELARELTVSPRHLRRAMEDRLGVSPVELAQTHRLALAKQLLQDTTLPITEVAFAAGFGSVRRFNTLFAETMGVPPTKARRASATMPDGASRGLVLRLDYRAPYAWAHIIAFLSTRAIPGVELVTVERYRRVVHLNGAIGVIEVRQARGRDALELTVSPGLTTVLMPLVARVRRLFDLDARPDVIAAVLGRDPALAARVARIPGLRVPGAIDPFEAAVRAMLGQQVSVAAATTLAGRFVAKLGTRIADGDGLDYRFPTAAEVVAVTAKAIAGIGLPGTRAAAIHALATAIVEHRLQLDGRELDSFVAAAVALPGIGPWTAHYLAMRALHLPDAFPASDLGIRKATGLDARAAELHAERWRPFRSYAVIHLWTSLGEPHADADDRLPARRVATRGTRRPAGRPLPSRTTRTSGRAGRTAKLARTRRDRGTARRILRR